MSYIIKNKQNYIKDFSMLMNCVSQLACRWVKYIFILLKKFNFNFSLSKKNYPLFDLERLKLKVKFFKALKIFYLIYVRFQFNQLKLLII